MMLSQFKDYYFWFTQPSSILSNIDYYFGYFFAGLVVLAIVLWIVKRFIRNQITSKLINKFYYLFLTSGLTGLIWFGMRFENTPIFSMHYWTGLIVLMGLVWLLFIVKYLIFNFTKELGEYQKELIKKKYLP